VNIKIIKRKYIAITATAFLTIAATYLGIPLRYVTIYMNIYAVIKSLEPRTTGVSYKMNSYFHKNCGTYSGGYISKINKYVQKQNYTWYTKKGYAGSKISKTIYRVKHIY